MRRPLKIAAAVVVVMMLVLAAIVVDHERRKGASTLPEGALPAAVVFTGQFDRIERALELLEEGRVERLLVSGVNPRAGLALGRFVDQFGLGAGLRDARAQGRIVLMQQADTTLQNAVETTCWWATLGLEGPLLLVTSRDHMPRASLALERALPGVVVLRHPVDRSRGDAAAAGDDDIPWGSSEFGKFVVTQLLGLVPASWHARWTRVDTIDCEAAAIP